MPYTPPSISPSGLHSISPVKSSSAYAGLANGNQTLHNAASKVQRPQPHSRPANHHRRSSGPQSPPREPIPVTAFSQGPRRLSPVRRRNSSSTDSSDGEDTPTSSLHHRHGRHLVNLKELRDAIRDLPQVKSASPPGSPDGRYLRKSVIAAADNLPKLDSNHARYDSATSDGEQSSSTTPPDDSIDFPRMVRKKSGEVVKPSLKSTQLRRRPVSMPSTPVYTKNVHFDSQLEHVRHFKHSEKPLAVSTNTSPTGEYASTDEFPFDVDKSSEKQYQIELPNWPSGDQISRGDLPVRVDQVYLSANGRTLIGKVYVKNLEYSKWVAVRFTFDHWQTVSEVSATYDSQQTTGLTPKNPEWDRFTFNIKLVDFMNIENRQMLFCVRFNVNDQEFWDNNYGANYIVEFRKRPNHLLRRASHPPEVNGLSGPSSEDSAISDDFDIEFSTDSIAKDFAERLASPTGALLANLGESKPYPLIKATILTTSPAVSSADIVTGTPQKRPTGKVFANRYDFSASLNAAIATANAIQGFERSGLNKTSPPKPKPTDSYFAPLPALFRPSPVQLPDELTKEDDLVNNIKRSHLSGLQQAHHFRSRSYPLGSPSGASTSWSVEGDREGYSSDDGGEKPPMDSSSYMDFINNYCFVSAPSERF